MGSCDAPATPSVGMRCGFGNTRGLHTGLGQNRAPPKTTVFRRLPTWLGLLFGFPEKGYPKKDTPVSPSLQSDLRRSFV